jgi:probable phosphomutase (TIGR03848 family)/uncharacterized repeat protein (TIGR03847 family)
MTEFLLIRHAVNDFVKTGKLAGWTPEVHLNDDGRAQAEALGVRLANTRIDAIYSSPLERTVETAQAVIAHHPNLELQLLEDVGEVRYGAWQGAELRKLYGRKLWSVVQYAPSRVRFPDSGDLIGETMSGAQLRAALALETLAKKHPRQRVAVVSHSDIIKMIVAYFLGLHLDLFQRIDVSPASLTVLSLHFGRATLHQLNETSYLPKPKKSESAQIVPATTITVDAVGEPGNRVFYLQARGENGDPVSVVIEKTQATMLADEIDNWFGELAGEVEVGEVPAFTEPKDALFRGGKFTLSSDADMLLLDVEEHALSGTPHTLRIGMSRQQAKTLSEQARRVVAQGRTE